MKKVLIVISLISTFISTGCFLKEKDLKQILFPLSIGLSYEENKYNIYLQILDTSTLSIVETESSQRETSFILIKAQNEDLTKALTQVGLQAQTYISAIKIKSLIIHKSVLDNSPIEFHSLMKHFINTSLFRSKIQLFTTNTKLEDFYSVQYMLVGTSVYSHTNEEEPQIIRGYVKPSFLLNSLKNYEENNRMYYIPIMDVTENTIQSGDYSGKLDKTKSYKYNGICFTTNNTSTPFSCLNKEEAMGYRWYNEVSYVNLELGDNKQPINIIVDKVTWKNKINNNDFQINVTLEGLISFNLTSCSIEDIKKMATDKVKEEILKTLEFAYNKSIDIYHLNDYAYRKNKNITYNTKNTNINVNLKLINSSYYTN